MGEPELDRIHIRDLLVRGIVGVRDWERKKKQDININITLETDLREAARSDRLEDTVDYVTIKQNVIHLVETSQFFLLERLAERIADVCLEDPRVVRARVALEKPGALRFARTVCVEIVRERGEEASSGDG
jgi:D-erythro-7,8-dihydroneopterin triphosphate epimerase